MKIRNLFRPFYVAGRIQNWLYEKKHPDHPWIAPGAIAWLEANLRSDMRGFEWGSGRSTLWFGRRLSSLTSIESNADWFRQVTAQVRQAGLAHVHVRHIPLDHAELETYAFEYPKLPANVAAILEVPDASLDLIIVDGWYRPVCTRTALPKLKPGGLLLIDNTDWLPREQWPVPKDWPLLHQSRNVLTQTSIWRKLG